MRHTQRFNQQEMAYTNRLLPLSRLLSMSMSLAHRPPPNSTLTIVIVTRTHSSATSTNINHTHTNNNNNPTNKMKFIDRLTRAVTTTITITIITDQRERNQGTELKGQPEAKDGQADTIRNNANSGSLRHMPHRYQPCRQYCHRINQWLQVKNCLLVLLIRVLLSLAIFLVLAVRLCLCLVLLPLVRPLVLMAQ